MKIVIAPDSYKESLSALEVATAIERVFARFILRRSTSSCRLRMVAKGRLKRWLPQRRASGACDGDRPAGRTGEAFYGLSGDEQCAFIEMAAASGLESVPPRSVIRC
jgi:glycerate kinase